jgi:hypothetical protein
MSNKAREALSEILELIDKWRTDGVMEHWQYSQLFDIADNALSEPLKNCDVGTPEEQCVRFKKWCEGEFYKRPMNPLTGEPCKSCPCYSVSANGVDGCNYLRWANMPYKKAR